LLLFLSRKTRTLKIRIYHQNPSAIVIIFFGGFV